MPITALLGGCQSILGIGETTQAVSADAAPAVSNGNVASEPLSLLVRDAAGTLDFALGGNAQFRMSPTQLNAVALQDDGRIVVVRLMPGLAFAAVRLWP